MALINDVKALCDRLGPLGWRDLLLSITNGAVDILQTNPQTLQTALTANVAAIDRTLPGFEDFSTTGQKAVTAGNPSESLLYHALASPLVVRDAQGRLLGSFPTLAELETLENYIFSLAADSLVKLVAANGGTSKVAFVVFCAEYRPAAETVDGKHADLVFSRTGVARVGTARAKYLPESRGFWPEDEDNPLAIRVMPAKFSIWLSVKEKGSTARVSPILNNRLGQTVDEPKRDFWIPIHKIFSGPECLTSETLTLDFTRRLLNVKIQKVHDFIGTKPLPTGFPYVLEDSLIANFSVDALDGSGLLMPTVHTALVAPATKDGKPVTYQVTPALVDDFAAFTPTSNGAPKYVHARTKVTVNGSFEDLNDNTDVVQSMRAAPYNALHYVDFTGEGWITVDVTGLTGSTPKILPAYILVSAPDLFPASGQLELSEWSRSKSVPAAFRGKLWNLPPTALSEIRLPANLKLPNTPFTPSDSTITAIVSMGKSNGIASPWPVQVDAHRATALPDDAAGVFAPGWDVGIDQKDNTNHLAAYSLGSPFPEDAKLCAALSTFWPAVAPDVFRTFVHVNGNTNGTIAPLTDTEIGQEGTLPWDGIPGPEVVNVGGERMVEYSSFLNADYVQLALQNRFSIRQTARLTADVYQERMLAACRVYNVLANLGNLIQARNNWLMLSFIEVGANDGALQGAQSDAGHILLGRVFGVKMCRIESPTQRVNARIERMPLLELNEFFVSASDRQLLRKAPDSLRFARQNSE